MPHILGEGSTVGSPNNTKVRHTQSRGSSSVTGGAQKVERKKRIMAVFFLGTYKIYIFEIQHFPRTLIDREVSSTLSRRWLLVFSLCLRGPSHIYIIIKLCTNKIYEYQTVQCMMWSDMGLKIRELVAVHRHRSHSFLTLLPTSYENDGRHVHLSYCCTTTISFLRSPVFVGVVWLFRPFQRSRTRQLGMWMPTRSLGIPGRF